MALSYAMLILLGGLNSTLMATVNTMPLGQVPMGYFIQKIGPSLAVSGGAGIVLAGLVSVLMFLPAAWSTP